MNFDDEDFKGTFYDEFDDFQDALDQALSWIFLESDGKLGYNAVKGVVTDLADRLHMESYKEGKERSAAELAKLKEENETLVSELSKALTTLAVYEQDYVNPLKEAGFDEHAKGIALAFETLMKENEALKAEVEARQPFWQRWFS